MSTKTIEVDGWAKPRGYANGMVGTGRTLHVAGQIGWGPDCEIVSDVFIEQFAQALDNVVAVVKAAGAEVTDIADMTIFVTDVAAYRNAGKRLGEVWRDRLGRHYPAMALIGVSELVEPRALVEIKATAHLGD